MRKKNNQILPILVFVLLFIGIVYAILQTDLQINGTTKIANNLWDVHFANIVVNQDSVAIGTGDTAATIDSNNTLKVDFSVTLSLPGDFYEFTVDVVNGGTIDAMIGTLNKTFKVNNVETETIPNYLNYTITYDDDSDVVEKQLLAKNSSKKIKVRVEFKIDINAEDLPDTTTLSMTVEPTYVQADSTAVGNNSLYGVFQLEAESGSGLVQKYTGEHKDSFNKPAIRDIYYFYGGDPNLIPTDHSIYIGIDGDGDVTWSSSSSSSNPGTNPNPDPDPDPNPDPEPLTIEELIQNKWNVLFAGFCWQMYRTTDTGGVKLIYNGYYNQGQCATDYSMNFAHYSFFTIGTTESLSDGSAPSKTYDSPIFVGYMYNTDNFVYAAGLTLPTSGNLYGSGVTYSNGMYTLTNTSTTLDDTHHYSCENTTGSCSSVRYYYAKTSSNNYYYTELDDGKNIQEIFDIMFNADNINKRDSLIKINIDKWYRDHLINYTSMLEDTIFCNDRSIKSLGGWNPNGGGWGNLLFGINGYNSLNCPRILDQFSLSNNKAKLTYPIGLMTEQETNLLNNSFLLNPAGDNSVEFWLLTPDGFFDDDMSVLIVNKNGLIDYRDFSTALGVRPVISLKPGTLYSSGDGSKDNPYVVG